MSGPPRWPLHRPVLGDEEVAAVAAVLRSGRLVQGPRVEALEQRAARLVGRRHAIAVSSGTAALHLATLTAGGRAGDEVLVPAFGYPATANAVEIAGGRAVPVDVDPDTFAVTPATLAAAITPQTSGLIAVHPFGIPAPMAAIEALAGAKGLWWIEDAACALGTARQGVEGGRWGRPGGTTCVSLHPRKTATSGEGGLLFTDDDDVAHHLRVLRNQGVDPRAEGWARFVEAGFNYRLSELHAAVGGVQLERLDAIVAVRRRVAGWYRAALADEGLLGGVVRWPRGYDEPGLNVQSLVVEIHDRVDRDDLIRTLRTLGVETTIGGYSLAEQPYYAERCGRAPGGLAVASRLARQSLTLPITHAMSQEDVRAVVGHLGRCVARQHPGPGWAQSGPEEETTP